MVLDQMQVWRFPVGAKELWHAPYDFAILAAAGVATSFTSTLMFTAMGSFFNRISDPDMVRHRLHNPTDCTFKPSGI